MAMLSYCVTFHMGRALAAMLAKDDDKEMAEQARMSPVAPATRSSSARQKVTTKRTAEGLPVHSFKSLLADLATIAANRIEPVDARVSAFSMITAPTPVQRRALDLLGVSHRLGYA